MSPDQSNLTSSARRPMTRRDVAILIAICVGAVAFISFLDSPASSAPVGQFSMIAAPSSAAPDPDDEFVEQVYVGFIVDNGLTLDNVQAKTGASEQQIKDSIRGCVRYNRSLIDRPGSLRRGTDCSNLRIDMALFPGGKPVVSGPPTVRPAEPIEQPAQQDLAPAPERAPTSTSPTARAIDAIKGFEAAHNLTEDQLAALTGKTEDALERRVSTCYTLNRDCDGQREVQSAIDAWEVSRGQLDLARRDQREAEAAAASAAN